jgi:hypothetical protein
VHLNGRVLDAATLEHIEIFLRDLWRSKALQILQE